MAAAAQGAEALRAALRKARYPAVLEVHWLLREPGALGPQIVPTNGEALFACANAKEAEGYVAPLLAAPIVRPRLESSALGVEAAKAEVALLGEAARNSVGDAQTDTNVGGNGVFGVGLHSPTPLAAKAPPLPRDKVDNRIPEPARCKWSSALPSNGAPAETQAPLSSRRHTVSGPSVVGPPIPRRPTTPRSSSWGRASSCSSRPHSGRGRSGTGSPPRSLSRDRGFQHYNAVGSESHARVSTGPAVECEPRSVCPWIAEAHSRAANAQAQNRSLELVDALRHKLGLPPHGSLVGGAGLGYGGDVSARYTPRGTAVSIASAADYHCGGGEVRRSAVSVGSHDECSVGSAASAPAGGEQGGLPRLAVLAAAHPLAGTSASPQSSSSPAVKPYGEAVAKRFSREVDATSRAEPALTSPPVQPGCFAANWAESPTLTRIRALRWENLLDGDKGITMHGGRVQQEAGHRF